MLQISVEHCLTNFMSVKFDNWAGEYPRAKVTNVSKPVTKWERVLEINHLDSSPEQVVSVGWAVNIILNRTKSNYEN